VNDLPQRCEPATKPAKLLIWLPVQLNLNTRVVYSHSCGAQSLRHCVDHCAEPIVLCCKFPVSPLRRAERRRGGQRRSTAAPPREADDEDYDEAPPRRGAGQQTNAETTGTAPTAATTAATAAPTPTKTTTKFLAASALTFSAPQEGSQCLFATCLILMKW